MEIWIKHANLVDFPYDPGNNTVDGLFTFDQQKVDNLVSEIMLASPTCYLVSGYRGAGKTSFIRRVQEGCLSKVSSQKKGQRGVLFVYSSFSRFENKTYFLRKLIRDLHEAATGWESKKMGTVDQGLSDLYRKTFREIKKEHSSSVESESSAEFSLDSKDFMGRLLKAFLPLLGPMVYEILPIAWQQKIFAFFPPAKAIFDLLIFAWVIIGAVSVTTKYTVKKTNAEKLTSNDLDDTDITEYDLEHVLDTFRKENFKIVFVLDELDKIEETELDQLLREMKPWLVKGKADFILVAGQRLTMKYYSLKERDDELLASLFSKIIHVNPMTEQQLSSLFKDFLVIGIAETGLPPVSCPMEEFAAPHAELAASICNSLIYRSKRLPRTFMNLIRQELQWRDDEAFLPIPDIDFKHQETKMKILRRLFEKLALNADVAETGKSHIIMQLFRAASTIHGKEPAELSFDQLYQAITNPDGVPEPRAYPYPEILPVLKACLQEFFKAAVDEQIILFPSEARPVASKEELSAATPTSFPEANRDELKAFTSDFDTFIQLLLGLSKELVPSFPHKGGETRIDELLLAYQRADIINLPFNRSVLLEQPVDYYRSKYHHPDAFEQLFELFTSNNISFHHLFDTLFRNFTLFKLQQTFSSIRFNRLTSGFMNDVCDFEIHFEKSSEQIVLLVDYKYIDGAVAVTSEEVSRAISVLDDHNIASGKGNYYLSVIFFKNFNGLDAASLSMSAHYQIEKVRPDLSNRINYLTIPIFSFDKFNPLLDAFVANIAPYKLTPVRKQNAPPRKAEKKKATQKPAGSSKLVTDPDDPQKGKWGGEAIRNGRKLSAEVFETDDPKWFRVSLKVESLPKSNPLTGKVTFYLHDEFTPDKQTVMARGGVAELIDLPSYEAFTVGVSCDNNTTKLELDLNDLGNAPAGFKY